MVSRSSLTFRALPWRRAQVTMSSKRACSRLGRFERKAEKEARKASICDVTVGWLIPMGPVPRPAGGLALHGVG